MNLEDGQGQKDKYLDTIRKILSQEMLMCNIKTIYLLKFNQNHKGIIKLELKQFWYEFVRHALYFVECAAALNEFYYVLPKSCLKCCMVTYLT